MLREYSRKFLALDVFALGFVLINGWAMYWDSTVEDAILPLRSLSKFLTALARSALGQRVLGDPDYSVQLTFTVRDLSLAVFIILMVLMCLLYFKEFHRGGKAVRMRYFITVLLVAACFLAEFFFQRMFPGTAAPPVG